VVPENDLNLKNKKNSTWTEYWFNVEEEHLLKQGLKLIYFDPSIDVGEI
jgi:hypothetical protein